MVYKRYEHYTREGKEWTPGFLGTQITENPGS